MNKTKIRAYVYVILCIISWALIPVCSKKVLIGMNNFAMLLFSNFISFITLGIYITFAKKWSILKSYTTKDYLYMSFLGILGSFVYYIFLYGAFSMATAQEVFIINYLWPVLIVIFAFFILKERLTPIKIISILISFTGVVIIVTKGNMLSISFGSIKGDIMAFFGAVSFSLFSVLGKGAKYDETIAVFIYFLAAFVVSLVFVPFSSIEKVNTNIIVWLVINGIFSNGISYIFWFYALKKGSIHIVSNAVYLTPFVALLFISLFLKEKIYLYSLVALTFIVSGILLQVLSHSLTKTKAI